MFEAVNLVVSDKNNEVQPLGGRHTMIGHATIFEWLHVCYAVRKNQEFTVRYIFIMNPSDFNNFVAGSMGQKQIISVQRMRASPNIPYLYRMAPVRRVYSFMNNKEIQHRYEMFDGSIEFSDFETDGDTEVTLIYEE